MKINSNIKEFVNFMMTGKFDEETLGNTNPKVGEVWESDSVENPFEEFTYRIILQIKYDY